MMARSFVSPNTELSGKLRKTKVNAVYFTTSAIIIIQVAPHFHEDILFPRHIITSSAKIKHFKIKFYLYKILVMNQESILETGYFYLTLLEWLFLLLK